MSIGENMTNNTKTIQSKVLASLQEGNELTAAQIKSRFGAGNPGAVIQALRFNGFPVYLNTVKDSKGRTYNKYRLGTASRAVIAAGYKAMAKGLVA
jgi:predicted transcriptional regulator